MALFDTVEKNVNVFFCNRRKKKGGFFNGRTWAANKVDVEAHFRGVIY